MRLAALLLLPLSSYAECQITEYTPALMNGWQNIGGGMKEISVWKDCTGTVHLAGGLMNPNPDAQDIAFVLPEGFRPTGHEVFSGATTSYKRATIYVTQRGEVVVLGDNTYTSISGIAFRTAREFPTGKLGIKPY